ncbi:hypothetical protein [Photobacterium lutimaris]|uniref:DUF2069 domain-containing protein n=1 Tax=Photobacterium lutimaris TaxID=388278 RepID=A0A2T3J083_9GAMM|nr:hypothetical protein [Photobacterium lutimaris]PSU34327.1 hypothetical protein C9I99_10110 [Photobacterium lutimaris]TDR75918.1 hypothetical protein DFP78_104281 [Photobacterium lutimaris]
MIMRIFPIVASFWLIAAHFLRYGAWGPSLLLAVFPVLLVIRHRWVPRVMSISLVLVALKWLQVTYSLISNRLMMGDDWLRMSLIMASVVCFTLMSVCLFQSRRLKAYYRVSAD